MGDYMHINDHELNSTGISSLAIEIMRKIFPDKKTLYGERAFTMSKDEIAALAVVVSNAEYVKRDTENLVEYLKSKGELNDNVSIDDIQWRLGQVNRALTLTMADMLVNEDDYIICKWV